MFNRLLFKKLLRDLWRRKLTLFALVLVLAAGITSYVSISAVYQDLDGARARYYNKYNLANFTIELKRAPDSIVPSLQNLPNVSRLRSRIQTEIMVNDSNFEKPIPGVAISMPYPYRDTLNEIKMLTGKWFSSSYAPEVILDNQFAKARNYKPGDRITVRFADQEYHLLVVGTSLSPEYVMILPPGGEFAPDPKNYAVMYLPRNFLEQRANQNSTFNQLLGTTKDTSEIAIKNTMALIADHLKPYGVLYQTAQLDQQSVKILHDELSNVKTTTNFFPTLFLLTAILILNVMLSRLVLQQRSIIGTLKAVGYSNAAIVAHYLFYGIVIGIIGGIVGIGFGIWLESYMLYMYKTFFTIPDMHLGFYPLIYLKGILICVVSTLIGSIIGARYTMKFSPAEAMRPPAPEIGKHLLVEKIKFLWRAFSFQMKMVMRAIFRNRFRSFVTISAAIIATTLVLNGLCFFDSLEHMINFSFDVMQHQDFNLVLREPLGSNIIRTIRLLPHVKYIEPQLDVPAELINGPHLERLSVSGLVTNNELYTPAEKDGTPIKIPPTGIVLTDFLAKKLHAKTGDYILLKPLLGRREEKKVRVEKIVTSYLGMSAYANQNFLSRLQGNSWLANSVLINLDDMKNKNAFVNSAKNFAPLINLIDRHHSKKSMEITMNQFLGFAVSIMVIFAAIISIGSIINTAMISLSERERDVASLRILGFTNYQVAKIFFSESILLNFAGIFIGILTGIGLTYYMSIIFSTDIFRIPFIVEISRIIETVIIMFAFVAISQLIVFRIIKKINWLDILNVRE